MLVSLRTSLKNVPLILYNEVQIDLFQTWDSTYTQNAWALHWNEELYRECHTESSPKHGSHSFIQYWIENSSVAKQICSQKVKHKIWEMEIVWLVRSTGVFVVLPNLYTSLLLGWTNLYLSSSVLRHCVVPFYFQGQLNRWSQCCILYASFSTVLHDSFVAVYVSVVDVHVRTVLSLNNVVLRDSLREYCKNRPFWGTYRLNLPGRRIGGFLPWRWRQLVLPKRRFLWHPRGATSHKTTFLIISAVETCNPAGLEAWTLISPPCL
jgi:hypothetical protein